MNVKEFIACLTHFPPDADVVVNLPTPNSVILIEADMLELVLASLMGRSRDLDMYQVGQHGNLEVTHVVRIRTTY